MSKKTYPRKLTTCSLQVKGQRRSQPPLIQNAGNNQLCDPVEIFTRNRKSKELTTSFDKESGKPMLGRNPSNRCLDRCCCVKPQLKEFGQSTQSQWSDEKTKPESTRLYDRSPITSPVRRIGFPKYLYPSPTRADSVPFIRYALPPPPPSHFPPRHVHLPRVSRPKTPTIRYPKRLDQWRVTKIPLKEPSTPGGTTIDELKKYITISGTRMLPKNKRPKYADRRKSIEEIKQYLVTSGSFEISRAQGQSTIEKIPRTPGPPNVTPKTSFENTDTSNFLFDTPRTSPPKINTSQENKDVEKMQPETGVMVDQLQALKKLLHIDVQKVENSSQFTDEGMVPVGVATSENMWQIVESVDDVVQFLDEDTMTEDPNNNTRQDLRSVVVSDKPRIKVIAEKFSKYKKNNLELRKIEEKLVCLEYDVYKKEGGSQFPDDPKAMQVMRAYFSFSYGDGEERVQGSKFSKLKEQFVTESHDDIKKLGGKEIEIIDGHLEENHSYINDLVKVLGHNKVIETKKNKTALDVLSLYDMAKSQNVIEEEDIHFLNHAQLAEVREMILKTCESSTHINRRKIPYQYPEDKPSPKEVLNVSKSIIDELYRESHRAS